MDLLYEHIVPLVLVTSATLLLWGLSQKFVKKKKSLGEQKIKWSIVMFSLIIIYWLVVNLSAQSCGMAETPARNIITGECKSFSDGCIDSGYKRDDTCPLIIDSKSETVYPVED